MVPQKEHRRSQRASDTCLVQFHCCPPEGATTYGTDTRSKVDQDQHQDQLIPARSSSDLLRPPQSSSVLLRPP
uniref:Uncharacterized protein n=1 Tax=Knipowitschia caucasica TaxID=637954 RepID=A0AAV2JF70_KNICA